MTGFRYEDIFATKHLEYLLVIVFLALLVFFWRFMQKPAGNILESAGTSMPSFTQWFDLPEGFYYHQGHSWAMPLGNLVKVGVDDFAQKIIGHINAVDITPVGSSIEQGGLGWRFNVDSKTIGMLSPIKGEVMEINERVFENPEIINQDPYGEGWLMKIRPHNRDANFKNLLSDRLAQVWTDMSIDALKEKMGEKMGGELGAVYQDGGTPVTGIARILDPDDWDSIVKRFLLTEE